VQHLSLGPKSLLVGDEAAEVLLAYATALGRWGSVDTVAVRGLSDDGGEVTATVLLNCGTSIVTETSGSVLPEPDNASSIARMREGLEGLWSRRPSPPPQEGIAPRVGLEQTMDPGGGWADWSELVDGS